MLGSLESAAKGDLLVLVSGDQSLYNDCSSLFKAISKNIFNLGGSRACFLCLFMLLCASLWTFVALRFLILVVFGGLWWFVVHLFSVC